MLLYWENLGSSIKKHKKRVFTKQLKETPSVQSEEKVSTKNSNKSFDLSDPSDTESDMKTVALELKDFITEEKNDVESFYKKFGKKYPKLSRAAKHFMVCPAKSVPCERLFSYCHSFTS